jgi:hypothetical protein
MPWPVRSCTTGRGTGLAVSTVDRKGVAGVARRSYAGGCLRQRFSPREQVEVVELLLKLTGIGLLWSMDVWSFTTMNGAADRRTSL